ncbi:MAG: hypothetical protein ACK5RO_00215 [Pseudobdellovibrionaceae bacterium]
MAKKNKKSKKPVRKKSKKPVLKKSKKPVRKKSKKPENELLSLLKKVKKSKSDILVPVAAQEYVTAGCTVTEATSFCTLVYTEGGCTGC